MSDEEKRIPNGAEGDPEEAEALKDILSTPAPKSQQADKNVFAQNLFGAPPPPPAPKPPAPTPPKPVAPAPPKPVPPAAPARPAPAPVAQKPAPPPPQPASPPPQAPSQPPQPQPAAPTAPPQTAQPEPPPVVAAPSPPPPPPPPPPTPPVEAEQEEEIRIVTPDFFDKFSSPEPPAGSFVVTGAQAVEGVVEGGDESDEDFPELAESAPAEQTSQETAVEAEYADAAQAAPIEEEEALAQEAPAATQEAPATEGWELESPVDESKPIDEAIGEAVQAAAQSAPTPEGWELESPVDESKPIEEAIGEVPPAPASIGEIPMKQMGTPVTLKAAKAREGAEAIEQAREVIEKLDGIDEGFLDVAEVRRGLKILSDIVKQLEDLAARISALEERLSREA